ncbi:histone deacetylase [Thiosulfatimonas sediminis]|uniref:Histone deacetylase n=1 Tax=Thiosulfatimonas sediminis TaxID=2675054 RepID=A0A6F8PRV5_9GAMM|nr:histone deacetylase family protein [Thiosulfatimonas sediminis]BBP44720.1 histone deacetylase [Thiosulfatimonas sediminis]
MYLYISHPLCKEHDNGQGHPENLQRISVIEDQLIAQGLLDFMLMRQARQATQADILRVHTLEMWDFLHQMQPKEGQSVVQLDSDTALSAHSITAARYAAGAVLDGVDALLKESASGVFCNVRPPGHHAEVTRAMGFCLFNNVAVGAAYALQKHGLERVTVLDFDVHHGNGTESFAQKETRLQFISSYQHGIYPYPRTESEYPNIFKIPMNSGTEGGEFLQRWQTQAWPKIREFRPQLILISAGFDAHFKDPLADLQLVDHDYVLWANSLLKLVAEIGNPPILSVLEGGYEKHALATSAGAYIKAMAQF